MTEPGPHQSLYRRFRPQRFGEVRGQGHLTEALRQSVRDGRPGHLYLFSGPRGTGKTSTARILAKALNCEAPEDGEPCGTCASCTAVVAGTSLDVHELDAASNNGVDAMRDLVSRTALATPGTWKVYIVDEVHMLSAAASNTLLKTLEEPPPHVVFVLATTDPQKVLDTIRSRSQHYEFRLLNGEALRGLVADVSQAAGLDLDETSLDVVARRGRGSARDALSALDQAAAAGSADEPDTTPDAAVEALCERDAVAALRAVASGSAAGRDARRIATDILLHLREAFLVQVAPELVAGPVADRPRLAHQAARLGPAGLLRAMEVVGQALIDMRDALEPRITLEVALVRVAQPDLDVSRSAVLERLERLERRVAGLGSPPPSTPPVPVAAVPPPPRGPRAPAPGPRRALGSLRAPAPPVPPSPGPPASAPAPAPAAPPPTASSAPAPPAPLPSRDELTKAWGDRILGTLPGRAKARFGAGRFRSVEDGHAVFVLPNEHFLPRCREVVPEVEAALAAHFGRPVPVRLVVDAQAAPGTDDRSEPDEPADSGPWTDAPSAVTSPEERLKQAFPGAEEVPGE